MNLMAVEALKSPPPTHFDPSFMINSGCPSRTSSVVFTFLCPKLNLELDSKGTRYTPYREVPSILPGETTNFARIIESPSFRLYVPADIDVVFSSFGCRKGIVLSALPESGCLSAERDG